MEASIYSLYPLLFDKPLPAVNRSSITPHKTQAIKMFFVATTKAVFALAMLGSVLAAPVQSSMDNQNLDLPIIGGLVNGLPIVGPILNSLTGTLGGLPIVGGLLGGLGGGLSGNLNVGVPGLGAVGVSAGASAGVPVAAVVPQSINMGASA